MRDSIKQNKPVTTIPFSIWALTSLSMMLSIMLTAQVSAAQNEHVSSSQPHIIVQQAATATFAKILAVDASKKGNNKVYTDIMEAELMPIVSYKFAAYKVLGSQARNLSKDQLQEFVEVFREYLVGNYAALLKDYKGQKIDFLPVNPTNESKEVSVRGIMQNPSGPQTNFEFRMRLMGEGDWKVYDIIAEGISMVDAKRNEFAPIIRTEGIDALISKMRKVSAA